MFKKDFDWESMGLMFAGLVVAVFSSLVLSVVLLKKDVSLFGSVAALVLVGFAAFVVLMNVLSFSAHVLKITDGSQPFGLPEGSIRALLTLSFIVLVGVLSAFLVTTGGGRSVLEKEPRVLQVGLDAAAANQYVSAYKGMEGVVTVEETPDKGKFDIKLYPRADNRLSDDISKQILTMLSTILAAMIGFYFGARTDAGSGTDSSTPDPSPESSQAASLLTRAKQLRDDAALGGNNDKQQTLDSLINEIGDLKADIDGADATLTFSTLLPEVKERVQKTRVKATNRLVDIAKRIDALAAPPASDSSDPVGSSKAADPPPDPDALTTRAQAVKTAAAGANDAQKSGKADSILGQIVAQKTILDTQRPELAKPGVTDDQKKISQKAIDDANAVLVTLAKDLDDLEKQ